MVINITKKPKISLSKIVLEKSGDSTKINLSKSSDEIIINLNWSKNKSDNRFYLNYLTLFEMLTWIWGATIS